MNSMKIIFLILTLWFWTTKRLAQGQTCTYDGQCARLYRITQRCGPFGLNTCVQNIIFTVVCPKEEVCTNSFNAWSSCSVTCGDGTRTRTGTCTGTQCSKAVSETEACNDGDCPSVPNVNGNWGEWSSYEPTGPCSQSCCSGTQPRIRTRSCDNPPPSGTGMTCPGNATETDVAACNTEICPVSCVGEPVGTFFPSPCGCSATYFRCEVGRENATEFTCGSGLVWSQNLMTCFFQCDS